MEYYIKKAHIFFPEPDANKSREWLIRAADNGSTKAISEIGILFLKGGDKTILESDAKRHLAKAYFLRQGFEQVNVCVRTPTSMVSMFTKNPFHNPSTVLPISTNIDL